MKSEDSKLKLLFGVAEPAARGGINACEPPFIDALKSLGHDVVESIYLYDNREGTSLMKRVAQVRKAASLLQDQLRNYHFDIVHLNTSFELRSLLRDSFTLRKLSGAKVFLKFHGSNLRLLQSANPVVKMLVGSVLGRAAGIGVLSSEERAAFVAAGFPEEKIFTVKNAVSQRQGESFPHVEKRTGIEMKLLFVSRLVPTKGLEDAVRATGILRRKGHEVSLDVLGDGEARKPAEALTSELGLTDAVHFHGHVDEQTVASFYSESDVLVFPTFHDEGFPMVVFNALRFGLPIVTTEIRAAADYLEQDENCLFCRPHDPEDVASCVKRLIENPGLRAAISSSNIELATRFTPETVATEYLQIYREIA